MNIQPRGSDGFGADDVAWRSQSFNSESPADAATVYSPNPTVKSGREVVYVDRVNKRTTIPPSVKKSVKKSPTVREAAPLLGIAVLVGGAAILLLALKKSR